MTRRSKWLAAFTVFTIVNVLGGILAVAQREAMHALSHVVLTLVGAFAMWRIVSRPTVVAGADELDQRRMSQLQNSLNAIAIEVGRVGETQRQLARIASERDKAPPASWPDTRG